MSSPPPSQEYKDVIDALVEACQHGSGQVGAQRARDGVWNRNASPNGLPMEHQLNEVLGLLPAAAREALAEALAREFEAGVFEAIKILGARGIAPLQSGFEGSAHEDFVGRVRGWEWPQK